MRTSLDAVDISTKLRYRTARANDHGAENRALVALAEGLVTSPQRVLQTLAESALKLCDAHSAGISILEEVDGKQLFRWQGVAGRWSRYLGGVMSRETSPCGTVLDRDASVLLARPERHYPIPAEVTPAISEVLLIPFHVGGRPVGTVWIIAHDETVEFDVEDERIIKNLGRFAASAYQVLASHEAIRQSEVRYRALVHATAESVWRMSRDGESILEMKSDVVAAHAATSGPTRDWLRTYVAEDDHVRVRADWARAVLNRSLYESEHRAIAANGKIRTWISRATPLLDANGEIREWIGASVDITEQRRAEVELRCIMQSLESQVARRTEQLADQKSMLERQIAERQKAESARMEAVKRLVETEESERRAISRELHDQVGQQLAVVSMAVREIGASQNVTSQSKILRLQDDLERLSKTVHDLALELRPSSLDDAGLLPVLTNYLDDWSQRTGIASVLHQTDAAERLPDAIATTLYRLVQEALTNIAKHARAKRVSVVLERRPESVRLIVEDDGQGFDVDRALNSSTSTRLGLLGMRERAALCGGELSVESGPQQGTAIYCSIPLVSHETSLVETAHLPRG